ncbi:autophagy-related protein 9-like [Apium graveolens]|uniref:autophagy-related protein 9-like n=1 Tax=Apium graveolens TaxID=4045 RepID=UPI003D79834C
MMFSRQNGANALDILKRKLCGESSLRTGLLNDSHEIELSDYQRAPSSGSESPSGLLDGDSLSVEPISDLDLFFERLYGYYCEKGLLCIVIKWIVELLSLAFTICFSCFFLLYVDWNGLRNAKCGMVAVESGIKPCDLVKEAFHEHPLTPFTLSTAIIVGYLGIFSIYWIFCFLRFFAQLKETLKIRQFYYSSLCITDNEMQTMQWASILEKVVKLQNSQQLCVVKNLSVHDIVMRLMRKDNYLIGMLNKGVLSFPVSKWVPGAGPIVKSGPSGTQRRIVLTKILEWTLNWCILQTMFDRNFRIRRDFISDPETLKKRLIIVGITMLVLSPFIVIFMLVYLFLKHAEQFYNHPSTASSRRWSNLSKWILREFNEVDHLFKHRINGSVIHASEYLKQFPSPVLSIVAKFISFVSGGFAAILIIIAFLEESLLEGHIFGRNLFWYAAVFGTITAISRAAVSDDHLVLDPLGAMSLVVQHTHYMPKRWRGKESSDDVRIEFETLFQYTGMMLLEEMASIFLTPYLLIFIVPERVDEILQFIDNFTADVEGVGHVCSFSAFDFQMHGNINYGAPCNSARVQRSSQGKMEKSFLSFQSSYPSWEPNSQGKQLISTLKAFREQKLQVQDRIPPYLPPRMQQWSPDTRVHGDLNNVFSREAFHNIQERGYQLGSLWLFNSEQKNYLNILEWYYTSGPHLEIKAEGDSPLRSSTVAESSRNLWMPPKMIHNEATHEENWGQLFDNDRSQNPLEVSTAAPLSHVSVLKHSDSVNAARDPISRSHWWARSDGQGMNAHTSFLEPPTFPRNTVNFSDSMSGRSIIEEEQDRYDNTQTSFLEPPTFYHNADTFYDNMSSRSIIDEDQDPYDLMRSSNRSHTIDIGDLDDGQFNLPFDDIYSRHSTSPELDPSNLG